MKLSLKNKLCQGCGEEMMIAKDIGDEMIER
jgi:ribosomal protein S27AE